MSSIYKGIFNEEKKKGLDGKACWKGYRYAGTQKKGGKTVDKCVKVNENVDAYDINELSAKVNQLGIAHGKKNQMLKNAEQSFQNKWPDLDPESIDYLVEIYTTAIANQHKNAGSDNHEPTYESEDQMQQSKTNSSAYREGYQDGLSGKQSNPRASEIFGPNSNDYASGYSAGVTARKEQQAQQVGQHDSDIAPYKNMSAEELQQRKREIEQRLVEIRDMYDRLRGSSFSFDPNKHLPKDHAELKAEVQSLNSEYSLIRNVLNNKKTSETSMAVKESRPTNIIGLLGSKGIGSLPMVEKIVDIRGQADGMSALVRTVDGNAYEVTIRPAEYSKHPDIKQKTLPSSDKNESSIMKGLQS